MARSPRRRWRASCIRKTTSTRSVRMPRKQRAAKPVEAGDGPPRHASNARAAGREIGKFFQQPGRMLSSLVRPLLWFLVFAAGFQNIFGVAIIAPYQTYIE